VSGRVLVPVFGVAFAAANPAEGASHCLSARLISVRMPTSCVISARARREASSTRITETPLFSTRSSSAEKPGLLSMSSMPAVAAFAKARGFEIVESFYDAAVSVTRKP
jgi:hypothetical protein